MEFGILFTSHPNAIEEPYPHRDVHARVTEIMLNQEKLKLQTGSRPRLLTSSSPIGASSS
jgi:hypothetical protein